MGEPATTAAPGTDNPQAPQEKRTCRDCGETKVVSPETWPYRNRGKGKPYQAHGQRCAFCETERKRKYEKRLGEIVAAVGEEPAPASAPEKPGKPADKAKPSKLDATKALKTGALALDSYAAQVMARVLEYADDPGHEHHIWALELLAQRILPRKLYEELGGQAAGIGGLQSKAPTYLIQVLPAGPAHAGRVIQGQHSVEAVQLLEGPEEEQ